MDLCRDCLEFAIAISKRSGAWVRPHGFWNEARRRSGFCSLCRMISDYKRDNAAAGVLALGKVVNLCYNSLRKNMGHRPLSSVSFRTESDSQIKMDIWSDIGSLADLCGAVCNKPPLPSDNCSAAFAQIDSWIQECLQNHEECTYTISNNLVDDIHGPKLPTRVLDVGCADNMDVTLIETQDERGKYCALSYCWGPPGWNHLLTTKANIKSHFDGIKLDQLPRTLQDAVIVTRQIGIRCIIQGDNADWTRESAKMAEVYQHAYLVIAASGAAHPGEGCFSKKRRYSTSAKIPHFAQSGQIMGSVRLSMRLQGHESPMWGPLRERGWAMQERYLARRTLHFMPNGISWRCRMLGLGERCPDDMAQDYDWPYILDNYSSCQLTYKEDRLIALEGLGLAVQEASGDKYTFGILESQLPELLLWGMEDDEINTSEDLGSVPTWCWAAKGGSKVFWSAHDLLGESMINNAELTIKDSWALRIQGVLLECKVSDTVIHGGGQKLEDWHDDINDLWKHRVNLYPFEQSSAAFRYTGIASFDCGYHKTVNVLFLNELKQYGSFQPEQMGYAALLLAPNTDIANSFRRIGMGFFRSDSGLASLLSASQVIYII